AGRRRGPVPRRAPDPRRRITRADGGMGKRRTQAQAAAHPRTQDPVPPVLQGPHAERDRRTTPDLTDARVSSAVADTREPTRSDPGAVGRLADRWGAGRSNAGVRYLKMLTPPGPMSRPTM